MTDQRGKRHEAANIISRYLRIHDLELLFSQRQASQSAILSLIDDKGCQKCAEWEKKFLAVEHEKDSCLAAYECLKNGYREFRDACIRDELARPPVYGPSPEEWEKAWVALENEFSYQIHHGISISPKTLVAVLSGLDPRGKPEPSDEFTSRDWLWG